MSKKAYMIAGGCFIVGVLLGVGGGYLGSTVYWGKQTTDGLSLIKEMAIAESGQQAFAAYQHESPPVAIYALNQYLDALQRTEELAGEHAVFMTRSGINFDAMLAHARLAKVYVSAGQPDRSAQQIAAALERANRDQKLRGITNEAALIEMVARMDKGATK